jgi:hypothetical protein
MRESPGESARGLPQGFEDSRIRGAGKDVNMRGSLMKRFLVGATAMVWVLASAAVPMALAQPREMDDREMDGVSGGITGSFDMTQSGNMSLNDNSIQSISLSDQAQQNLSSLVNILSINSTIQVMLNLNVNINSSVGTVNQGNNGTQAGPP